MMRCRFDGGHGTFSNAVVLRRHYDEVHADEYAPSEHNARANRRVTCTLCGIEVAYKSLRGHVRGQHGARAAGRPMREMFEAAGALPARTSTPARATRSSSTELPPLHADDIVQTVVEQLAEPGGLLPVVHLAAVFAWRDATAAFLAAVAPRRE